MQDINLWKHFKAIGNIKSAVSGASDLEEALRGCAAILRDTCDAETVAVWYRDSEHHSILHPVYLLGVHTRMPQSVSAAEGITGRVFSNGETVFLPAFDNEETVTGFAGVDIHTLLCVPLQNEFETLGCIQLVNRRDGGSFTQEDADVCEILSMLAATEIDAKGLDTVFSPPREVMLSLRDVTKEFQNGDIVTRVLRGVDLDVFQGELLVVLGESGCGKSTMLNIIGGMDRPTGGKFLFHGADFSQVSEELLTEYRREHIGFIFQSYNLMPNLTALQNLRFIAELKEDAADPEEIIKLVGLWERRHNYPAQMSGGQQQRVSIARALVKNPKLILADEPTAALDYATSIEILTLIEQVAAAGTCIVMVTHNEEITKMADRVIRMRGGLVDEVVVNRHPCKATELVW